MPVLYVRAADFIRERRFEVHAPAFYHPNQSTDTIDLTVKKRERPNPFKFVETNFLNPLPMRMHVNPDQMQWCSYTIEIMLDMFQKKIPFEIAYSKDLPEIFDGLDRYLLSLHVDVQQGVENSIAYARLVVAWRAEVFKHYYRYMMENPTMMEELYPNNNKVDNIFTLLAAIGGLNYDEFKHDPLKARARPPYDINTTIPVASDPVSNVEDYGMDARFKELESDKKGFDLQGFLNGK